MKYFRYLINFIASFFYDLYYFIWGDVRSRVMGLRYYRASKQYPGYLTHGNMAEAAQSAALRYCRGAGLDIGAGRWPLPGARAVEDNADENAYRLKAASNSQDFIFSSHTLEHLERWPEAIAEWGRVLKNGGALFLYLPHPACAMWQVGVNLQHLWAPAPETLTAYLADTGLFTVLEYTKLPDGFLSFMVVARKK